MQEEKKMKLLTEFQEFYNDIQPKNKLKKSLNKIIKKLLEEQLDFDSELVQHFFSVKYFDENLGNQYKEQIINFKKKFFEYLKKFDEEFQFSIKELFSDVNWQDYDEEDILEVQNLAQSFLYDEDSKIDIKQIQQYFVDNQCDYISQQLTKQKNKKITHHKLSKQTSKNNSIFNSSQNFLQQNTIQSFHKNKSSQNASILNNQRLNKNSISSIESFIQEEAQKEQQFINDEDMKQYKLSRTQQFQRLQNKSDEFVTIFQSLQKTGSQISYNVKYFEDNLMQVLDKSQNELEVQGFYGQYNIVVEKINKFFDKEIKLQEELNNLNIKGFQVENKFALVFILPQYIIDNRLQEDNGVKKLLKILQDCCPKINLCLSDNFDFYETENQFVKQPQKGYQIKTNSNSIKRFNVQQSNVFLNTSGLKFSKNIQKPFLLKTDLIYDVIKTENNVSKTEIENLIFKNNNNCKQEQYINYGQVKTLIYENLENIKNNYNVDEQIQIIKQALTYFVDQKFKQDFQEQLDKISQEIKQAIQPKNQQEMDDMTEKQRIKLQKQLRKYKSQEFLKNQFEKITSRLEEHDGICYEYEENKSFIRFYLQFIDINYNFDNQNNLYQKIDFYAKNFEGALQLDNFQDDFDIKFQDIILVGDDIGFIIAQDYNAQNTCLIKFQLVDQKIMLQNELQLSLQCRIHVLANQNLVVIFDNDNQQVYKISYNDNLDFDQESVKEIPNFYKEKFFIVNQPFYLPTKQVILFQKQDLKLYQFDIKSEQISKYLDSNQMYQQIQYIEQSDLLICQNNKSFDFFIGDKKIETFFQITPNEYIFKILNENKLIFINLSKNQLSLQTNDLETSENYLYFQEINVQNGINKQNTLLDYFYCVQKNFGKKQAYQETDELNIIIDKKHFKKARQIFNISQLQNYDLQIQDIDVVDKLKINKFQQVLQTRVPLKIAAISNKRLVPLYNENLNIRNLLTDENYTLQNFKLVENLVQKVNFGVYENINNQTFEEIKIISVIGQHNQEKDILLNELFCTRFNFYEDEIFNGVQLCLYQVNEKNKNVLYVLLNVQCFSSNSLQEEEKVKLTLLCASISNLTIFYNDDNLGQQFDKFVQHLCSIKGKLNGQKLFKGNLLILIQKGKTKKKFRELKQTLIQKFQKFCSSNYQIFQSKSIEILEKSTSRNYQLVLNQIRNNHLNQLQGQFCDYLAFIDNLKVVLVQIFLNDQYDMDKIQYLIKMRSNIKKILYDSKEMIYNDLMKNKMVDFQQIKNFINLERIQLSQLCEQYNNKQIDQQEQIQNHQSFINSQEHPLNNGDIRLMKNLFEKYFKYEAKNHEHYLDKFELFAKTLYKAIFDIAKQQFEQVIIDEQKYEKINCTLSVLLNEKLTNIYEQYELCKGKCFKCDRQCTRQKIAHTDPQNGNDLECNCFTDHRCIELCIKDKCQQSSYQCAQYAIKGHQHLCAQGKHNCTKQCEKHDKCDEKCAELKNHISQIHQCLKEEICKQKCKAINCNNICKKGKNTIHDDDHQCHQMQCNYKCIYCDKKCIFKSHFHENRIQKNETQNLMQNGVLLNYHICGNEHNCPEYCCEEGECEIVYNQINGNIVQKRMKKKCSIKLKKNEKFHEGQHQCVVEFDEHICSRKCPQCGTFCQKQIGHEGLHHSNNHRVVNQDFQNENDHQSQITYTSIRNIKMNQEFCYSKTLYQNNMNDDKYWQKYDWQKPEI